MLVSQALALGSAACLALSSMFVGELKGRVPAMQLARWQMLATFLMTGAVSLALGGWQTLAGWQVALLSLSSVFGIVVATSAYLAAIYAIGPRLTALLFALTAPFALILGYLAFGETVSAAQGAGVALVLAGIGLAIGVPGLAIGVPRRFRRAGAAAPAVVAPAPAPLPASLGPAPPVAGVPVAGLLLGVVTAIGQALGSLDARPAMAAGVEPFTAMAVRSGFAALCFVALLAWPGMRRARVPREAGAVGLAIASAFFGTALGMSLLMAALHGGEVGIVSTLSSTTPVLILPMVWLRERQAPPPAAWVGAALAILGTAAISLG